MKENMWNTNKGLRIFKVISHEVGENTEGRIEFKNDKIKFAVNKYLYNRHFNIVDNKKNTVSLNMKAYQMLRENGVELEQLVF
jgi:hypothetical protein